MNVERLKKTATVDWRQRERARAKMRGLERRILKRFGYPPDLDQSAEGDRAGGVPHREIA